MWEAPMSLQTFFRVQCSYNYNSSELSFSLFLDEPSVLSNFFVEECNGNLEFMT